MKTESLFNALVLGAKRIYNGKCLKCKKEYKTTDTWEFLCPECRKND